MKTKNILRTLLTCAFFLGVLTMNAQTNKIYVYKADKTTVEFNIADIDSISFTAPATPAEVDYTKLVLNEVSGNNKFVEIYNSGTVDIPLDGVKLQRNDGASEWDGTSTDIIPAGAYRLILFNAFTAGLDANEAYVGWTVGSGISAGQVLKVAIVDPSGTEVSVFIRGDEPLPAWGSTTGVTSNTTDSYSRMSDGSWAYAAPTPGEANGTKTSDIVSPGYLTATPPPPTPPENVDYTKLVLNEISGTNKFVEIYNSGTVDIPLTGVKLQRNDGPVVSGSSGSEWTGTAADVIPAGTYRLFLFNSYTPADLATNPAYVGWTVGSGISASQVLKVAIIDPSGTPVSVFIRGDVPLPAWQYSTGVASSTDSYSRMADGTWAYATPTPGDVNGAKTSDIVTPGYLTAQP